MGSLQADRDCNLDLLRALAILGVVVFHVIELSPVSLPGLMRFVKFGEYGVDLFFVLSGWLIGSLYWREYARFGNVELIRFWLRRWLRTIPPYWTALLLVWLAAFNERHELFDWGYLAFSQNYYRHIPFFLASWSLCVEEHFYLFLPLLLICFLRNRRTIAILFIILIMLAPAGRWWESFQGLAGNFGYETTATHLRMEGLLMGFGAAYLASFCPLWWHEAKRQALRISGFFLVVFMVSISFGLSWKYRISYTALAFCLCGLLIFLVNNGPLPIASATLIKWIAQASYSVYLTHTLMIHVASKFVTALPVLTKAAYFPIAFVLICGAGAGFYYLVERTCILCRDLWVPRRAHVRITIQ